MTQKRSFRELVAVMLERVERRVVGYSNDFRAYLPNSNIQGTIEVLNRRKKELNRALQLEDDDLVADAAELYLRAAARVLNIPTFDSSTALEARSKKLVLMLSGYERAILRAFADAKSAISRRDVSALEARYESLDVSVATFQRQLSTLELEMGRTAAQLVNIQKPAEEKLNSLDKMISDKIADITSRSQGFDSLVSLASGEIIARSYKTSADTERKAADWLRWGSLAFMTAAIGWLIFSFHPSGTDSVTLQTALVRLAQVALLTVPGAYLARESTKHRKQQYLHQQTALDLEAITPYISTLPIETQHKLKENVAAQVFAPKSFDDLSKDSYPINIHELTSLLLSKVKEIDLRGGSAKSKKTNRTIDKPKESKTEKNDTDDAE